MNYHLLSLLDFIKPEDYQYMYTFITNSFGNIDQGKTKITFLYKLQ